MDEQWHPFSATPMSWYRVWKKKLIQRATFESDAEQETLFPMLMTLPPIENLSLEGGFREELHFELRDDQLYLVIMAGYALSEEKNELLQPLLRMWGGVYEERDTLAFLAKELADFAPEYISEAQRYLEAMRLCYQALQSKGPVNMSVWKAAQQAAENYLAITSMTAPAKPTSKNVKTADELKSRSKKTARKRATGLPDLSDEGPPDSLQDEDIA